jgi:hypothetical protein
MRDATSADHPRASSGISRLDCLLRCGFPTNRLQLIEGVGEPLAQFHGVLTGVPHYQGGGEPLMDQDGLPR